MFGICLCVTRNQIWMQCNLPKFNDLAQNSIHPFIKTKNVFLWFGHLSLARQCNVVHWIITLFFTKFQKCKLQESNLWAIALYTYPWPMRREYWVLIEFYANEESILSTEKFSKTKFVAVLLVTVAIVAALNESDKQKDYFTCTLI